MRLVVVMDPVSTVKVDADTSFALMEEAQRRGHRVDHCLPRDLYLDRGRLSSRVAPARMQRDPRSPITLGEPEEVCLHDVDAVLIRPDPPFDQQYLWLTQMLERLRGDTFVLNDPRGVRDANEKLFACNFAELMPETIVTSDKARIRAFAVRVGGQAVVKPLDGKGGEGVMVLREGDPNFNAIIEGITRDGTRMAMAQVYLPEIGSSGDKRIMLLDGEPLASLLRFPAAGDIRSNLRAGGRAVKTSLDGGDERIVKTLSPVLRAHGLYLAGIDVIGGKLTEINVTSPTGIQAMNRLDGVNYTAKVLDFIERRAASP